MPGSNDHQVVGVVVQKLRNFWQPPAIAIDGQQPEYLRCLISALLQQFLERSRIAALPGLEKLIGLIRIVFLIPQRVAQVLSLLSNRKVSKQPVLIIRGL